MSFKNHLTPMLLLVFVSWMVSLSSAHAAAVSTRLAEDGKALLPIIIAKDATSFQLGTANTLAAYLGKISGAKFEVKAGDGKTGIVIGVPSQFPALALGELWDAKDVTRHEDYLLRSHADGLYLLGAGDLAIDHAVWDLLYRLGYRQFFPGPVWEVVPKDRALAIAVDTKEHPAYYARRIWYGFGAGPWVPSNTYGEWCARNRADSGIELSSGHSYDAILKRNKAEFDKHPEYLGLIDGKRTSTKFCISNPGLRQLIVNDALGHFAKSPESHSISLDPSDGGHWCECENCKAMGSISDRAVTLANTVAEAVEAKYPGKFIGMYAYNYHSPPPNISVNPRVVVSVATAFIKGGNTFDEILAGWGEKGAMLGIREYYSVNTWDRDMPGHARGGNIEYLTRTIPEFNSKGARFLSAESSNNWGPNGLGYYLASRMMWDPSEAKRVNELTDDFLTRAFGSAKEPMREFYNQIDGSKPHLVFANQLGQMFRSLDEARKLASTPDVKARIDDLILYAHYVELYDRYSHEKDAARQAGFEALIKHAFRMRTTQLVHTYALYRDLASRDKTIKIPPEAAWKSPVAKNPWASSEPFTDDERAKFLADGIAHYPLTKLDFEPVVYSEELVSAAKLNLPVVPDPKSIAAGLGAARGKQTFYTLVEKAPATLDLHVTGGLIEHYRDRGNVRLELRKIGGASATGERETLVAEDRSAPPDGKEHAVSLAIKEPGLYKLTLDDGSDRTLMTWTSTLPMTVKSSSNDSMNKNYSDLWLMYFYVPEGTKTIGLFGGDSGEVRDSSGRPVFWLNGRAPNYYSVTVPDGEAGKLWSVRYGRGAVRLLTVPPYFARSATELLLPAEVVAKDAGK